MYKLHAKNKKRGRSFQHEEEQRNERINDERKKKETKILISWSLLLSVILSMLKHVKR